MDQKYFELLLRSFDEELDAAESQDLARALRQYPALRTEQAQIQEMREQFAALNPGPGLDFADRVLQALPQKQVPVIQLKSYAYSISVACLLVLLMAGTLVYQTGGSLSTEAIVGVQNLGVEEAYTLLNY